MNNILLKFHHFLLRMPKIIQISQIIPAENVIQKHNQHPYK